ncbi:hypothetical protein NUW58_g1624 [Xylaria curta]|uniref:Uncharacterized protein n=1 Tax=Xylaria curta TaxID=42375 RepID=A0ACC1PJX4_9PEZI|nr:hypothetical protein NUW58_g1624 [Xylaria curta]
MTHSQHPTSAQAYELGVTYATILRHVYSHPDFHYQEPPTALISKVDLERTPKGLFFTVEFLQNTYVNNVIPLLPQGATRKCKELGNPWAFADPNYQWEWTWDAESGTMKDADGNAIAFPKLSLSRVKENASDLVTRNLFAKMLILENGTDPRAQALVGGRPIDFGQDARAAAEKLHVTASEGVDREVTGDDDDLGGGLWRPLSYNPLVATDCLESPEQVVEPFPHIAAYKVSAEKRLAQVIFGAVMCCLASGIVFGFASLKPILIAEGVYSELCPVDSSDEGAPDIVPCPEQDMRLNLFFVAASITANISALFAGYSLDHYGRRTCYIIASIFIAAGSVLLGYAFAIPQFDGYVLGNVMLSLGGTFLFVPSFRLANAFPKFSGLIVAVITGSFDASAAVLLLYQLAWEATNGSFAPSQFFFAYTIIPVILLIGEFTLMPRDAYQTTPDLELRIEKAQDATRDIHDSDQDVESPKELYRVRANRADRRLLKLEQIENVLGDADEREERAHKNEEIQQTSGVWGVLHGLPAHRQMMTAWFILILLLTVVQMLKMNNFISTVTSQYRYLLQSDEDAESINRFFGIALPLGGIATTPFIGLLLNSWSMTAIIGLLTGFIASIGILNCLPFMWAGYATVVLFVIFRPLYYSAMSDYATKVFGFATFGRLYGAITCISGVLTFSQYGLDALAHGPLDGNPTPINIMLTVAGTVVGLYLMVYVAVKSRDYREETQECIDPQEEQMCLMRERQNGYGAIAHVCVSTTARQAAEKGWDVIIPKDAVGDRHIPGVDAAELVRVALSEIADAFGTIIESKEIS